MGPNTHTTEWSLADDDLDTAMGPATTHDVENGAPDVHLDDPGYAAEMAMSKPLEDTKTVSTRDRQVKPNKVYIGGLPDHTRPEDLRNCFGKLGNIVTIELKLGYGFVEFDSKESAEESVARYHDGYFMGNKIRVEPSHSRGRTFKRPEDPGACYSCGESGHWARECPRSTNQSRGGPMYDQPSHDRGYSARDHHHSQRDTHSHREEYSRHTSSRDDRFYDTPSAPPPPTRNQRRALTPTRERRDDPPPRREYDDYRTRSSPPPLPPPPPPQQQQQQSSRYDRSGHHGTTERDFSSNGAQSYRDSYDRYDRRQPHSDERSVPYSLHSRRPRTPPGPPPPGKDDFDNKPPRGHYQTQETYRRAATPPPPYPGNNANGRSRRRSLSPPRYGGPSHSDGDRYSNAPREGTRVRDYHHRSGRGEDSGHRRL